MNPLIEGNVSKSGHEWLEKVNREGMNKHTPGPWNVHGRDTRGLPHSLVAAETLIAKVYSKCYGDVEQETANANLIAAAPDLLEALQELLYAWDQHQNPTDGVAEDARSAIAKALTGESQ